MRYHFLLHYGWFLQNLEKDFIPTLLHTTVAYLECVKSYAWSKGHSEPDLSRVDHLHEKLSQMGLQKIFRMTTSCLDKVCKEIFGFEVQSCCKLCSQDLKVWVLSVSGFNTDLFMTRMSWAGHPRILFNASLTLAVVT